MSYLPPGLPQPVPESDALDKPYWDATLEGKLRVQRCKTCRTWIWGPEWMCHHCQSFDLGWEDIPDTTGVIYSWERVWHPVHPVLKNFGPYVVVLVELPEAGNIRMPGNLLGDPLQDVVIGNRVRPVFEPHSDASAPYALVQWQRIDS